MAFAQDGLRLTGGLRAKPGRRAGAQRRGKLGLSRLEGLIPPPRITLGLGRQVFKRMFNGHETAAQRLCPDTVLWLRGRSNRGLPAEQRRPGIGLEEMNAGLGAWAFGAAAIDPIKALAGIEQPKHHLALPLTFASGDLTYRLGFTHRRRLPHQVSCGNDDQPPHRPLGRAQHPEHGPIQRPGQPLDAAAFGKPDQGEQRGDDAEQRLPVAFDGEVPIHIDRICTLTASEIMDYFTPLHPSMAVEWNRACFLIRDNAGRVLPRWLPTGMPKLGEYKWLLDSVFFVYETKEHARKGVKAGGTGFLVALPSRHWPDHYHHIYAITNWHNACRDGASVIRINKHDGPPEILDIDPSEWHFIPGAKGGHDIAVIVVNEYLRPDVHKVQALGPNFFLNQEEILQLEVGPADDVFMVGRFVDYDGVEANQPALRFGHISIFEAPIRQVNGCNRPSHVIDMHSRSGYSGSPVFVYRTAGSMFFKGNTFLGGGHTLKLLGIHWGQFPEEWELKRGGMQPKTEHLLIVEGEYVKGLSGMTCVSPAYAIMEVLNLPVLQNQRDQIESALFSKGYGRDLPLAESASRPATDANPNHQEDFSRLLDLATRTPPRDD
jgi:hypothetical protein